MTNSAPTNALPPLTLERLVRPRNQRLMILWALLAAAFAGWLYWFSDTLGRVYNGPEPVTVTQLLAMKPEDAAGRFFEVTAQVKPAHLLQTTTETKRRRGGTSTRITNHFAFIQGGALLVETDNEQMTERFYAWSKPFLPGNNTYDRAVKQLGVWAAGRGTTIAVAPTLLQTSSGPDSENWLYGSIIGAATLGLLVFFMRNWGRLRNYLKSGAISPLYNSVRSKEGIPVLVADIDRQLATRDPAEKPKGWELFPGWLVVYRGPQLLSVRDIMWVAGFTKGKEHLVRVTARDGKAVDLVVRPEVLNHVLGAFHYRAPWAMIGPDPAFEAHYLKQPGIWAAIKRPFAAKGPSKGELIRECDARRTSILAELAQVVPTAAAPSPAATSPPLG